MALLHDVLGIENPVKAMEFEIPVKTITKEKGSDYIDAYITATKVLIEQKGSHVDLSAKYRQSDGSELTPYQQARRYAAGLPVSITPRWIVACNFSSFEVHDMERPNDAPEIIQLTDLENEYHRLTFLVDDTNVHLKKELEVSIQAGEIVGVLYDKILAQYRNPDDPETQKSLNKLCVRLVFCLYAEDAGVFGTNNMFHDYLAQLFLLDISGDSMATDGREDGLQQSPPQRPICSSRRAYIPAAEPDNDENCTHQSASFCVPLLLGPVTKTR